MIPQGTSLVNAAFFTASIAAVNGAQSCAQLTQSSSDAVASLEAEIATVTTQIALLSPLLALPTDLPSVLTWITNFVAPMALSHTNYTAQLVQLNAKLAALNVAVAARASALGCP